MGLDCTAVSKVEFIDEPPKAPEDYEWDQQDWEWENGYIRTFAYAGFEASTRGLPNHDVESTLWQTKIVAAGWVKETQESEKHKWYAGNYDGYNEFRKMIAKLGSTSDDPTSPFFELVHFADNEGTIGPDAAADLLQDFVDHGEKWVAQINSDFPGEMDRKYYLDKYEDWIKAFRLAADHGIVDFY